MSSRTHARARLALACAAIGLALSACGDDGPTGPSEDFDIVGAWSWRATNATGGGVTCSVTNVTLTFTRENGTLTGTQFSPGNGNMPCVAGSASEQGSFATNTSIKELVHTGTSISFEFHTSHGAWVMTGSIKSDNSMGGNAAIRVNGPSGAIVTINGPWTATRN